jgi:hypothetical protein
VIHDQVHDMPDESERPRNDHRRDKSDKPAAHPLLGDEMPAFRRLRKDNPHGEFVFVSERDVSPFTEAGFAKLVARAGVLAAFPFKVHPQCFAMSVATSLRMGAGTRGRFRTTSASRTSSTR